MLLWYNLVRNMTGVVQVLRLDTRAHDTCVLLPKYTVPKLVPDYQKLTIYDQISKEKTM